MSCLCPSFCILAQFFSASWSFICLHPHSRKRLSDSLWVFRSVHIWEIIPEGRESLSQSEMSGMEADWLSLVRCLLHVQWAMVCGWSYRQPVTQSAAPTSATLVSSQHCVSDVDPWTTSDLSHLHVCRIPRSLVCTLSFEKLRHLAYGGCPRSLCVGGGQIGRLLWPEQTAQIISTRVT